MLSLLKKGKTFNRFKKEFPRLAKSGSFLRYSIDRAFEKKLDESLQKFASQREKNLQQIKEKKMGIKSEKGVQQLEEAEEEEEEEEGEEEQTEEEKKEEEKKAKRGGEEGSSLVGEGWKTWEPIKPTDKTRRYESLEKYKIGQTVIPEKLRRGISKLLRGYSRDELQHNADELSKLLRRRTRTLLPSDAFSEKGGKPHIPVAYNSQETFAYVVHRVPGIYGCLYRVLEELGKRFPQFAPSSLLDFGSGPGTVVWAASEKWPNSLRHFLLVEPSSSMTSASSLLLRELELPSSPKIERRRFLYSSSLSSHDLVVASYSLSEISDGIDRNSVLKNLWSQVREGGMLVLVESGTPTGFSVIKQARHFLLQSFSESSPNSDPKILVVAPCLHNSLCPMPAHSWCHFVQRVRRTPLQMSTKLQTSLNYEDEKFSYVILHKPNSNKTNPNKPNPHNPNPHNPSLFHPNFSPSPQFQPSSQSQPSSQASPENESEKEPEKELIPQSIDSEKELFAQRIVRPPSKRTGHVQLSVCTQDGNLEEILVSKKMGKELFTSARKSFWGDVFLTHSSSQHLTVPPLNSFYSSPTKTANIRKEEEKSKQEMKELQFQRKQQQKEEKKLQKEENKENKEQETEQESKGQESKVEETKTEEKEEETVPKTENKKATGKAEKIEKEKAEKVPKKEKAEKRKEKKEEQERKKKEKKEAIKKSALETPPLNKKKNVQTIQVDPSNVRAKKENFTSSESDTDLVNTSSSSSDGELGSTRSSSDGEYGSSSVLKTLDEDTLKELEKLGFKMDDFDSEEEEIPKKKSNQKKLDSPSNGKTVKKNNQRKTPPKKK